MLFDSFEAYDVQETRRVSREEGLTEGRIQGKLEGRIEGRIQGKLEGKIESILELLRDIGQIPDTLTERIQSETNLDIINTWFKIAAKAVTIEEFQTKAKL